MFQLFETIQILDGEPMHLAWHQARLNRSYRRFFKKAGGPVLEEVIRIPGEYQSGKVKCKLLYNRQAWTTEFEYYVPRKIKSLRLVNGDHLEYSMKYTDRYSLGQLFEMRGNCDEILIIKNGKITDTSYTNVILNAGNVWVTPLDPLLEGTCRARLIGEGKVIEREVRLEQLREYKSVKLINAMIGPEDQEEIPLDNVFGFESFGIPG